MSHGESRPHPVDRKELSGALGSKSGNVHGWSAQVSNTHKRTGDTCDLQIDWDFFL